MRTSTAPGLLLALTFLLGMAAISMLGYASLKVLWWYLGLSIFAFFLYAWDKYAAIKGWRRISEKRLHLVSLLGGWPGALCAQVLLRHKTLKVKFRRLFWLTLMANVSAFVFLLSPYFHAMVARVAELT